MNNIALHWLGHSYVVVAAATLIVACADPAPLAPARRSDLSAQRAAATANSVNDNRAAELGTCDSLRVPQGNKVAFHVYAEGVQIYRWNGASWTFVAPSASLSADPQGMSTVGTHYAGPTWQTVSGGKVVGVVTKRCVPDRNAIPWLLLSAIPDNGPGVFQRTTFIQRVNTVGGNAPSAPGSFTGEETSVPYTAEYFFYRPQ